MAKRKDRDRTHKRAVIRQGLEQGKSASQIAKDQGWSYQYVQMVYQQERTESAEADNET